MTRRLLDGRAMSQPAAQSVEAASFVVAIDGFEQGQEHPSARGSAIILGPHHLLTCWHVVQRREAGPWGRSDKLLDELWARLSLAHAPAAASLECVGSDSTLDVALLYSPSELKAPVARWLDASSMRHWLRRSAPWVALGYPETTRQLSRHRGKGWLGENRDYLQLPGGIPAGFSGGALVPEHGELCAGLIQLGGKKSPVSVALPIGVLEKFLSRFQGRDAIELQRVSPPGSWPSPEAADLRSRGKGRLFAVIGAVCTVLGALAGAWSIWGSRTDEKPALPVPTHAEQPAPQINMQTFAPGSPIIPDNKGVVNVTVTSDGEKSSKEPP